MKLWINFGEYYFNRLTGEIIYKTPKNNPNITNLELPNWKIVKGKDGIEYFFNEKINVNTWRIPQKLSFNLGEYYPYKGPSYGTEKRGNTCFLDSVIVCIFSTISPFTNYLLNSEINSISQYKINPCKSIGPEASIKSINQIREELKNLQGMLIDGQRAHESKNISRLLDKMNNCGKSNTISKFCSGEQGDVTLVIEWILGLLPINNKTIEQKTSFVSEKGLYWKKLENRWLFDSSPIYIVDFPTLVKSKSDTNLKTFLKMYDLTKFDPSVKLESLNDDKLYSKKVTINSMKYTPILFINVNRLFGGMFLTKKVIPDEYLELPSGQKFKLTSIIVFEAGHYWCYFYAPGSGWFYYNDAENDGKPEEIGDYSELLEEDEITKNGVLYKYSLIETEYWGQEMPLLEIQQKLSSLSSIDD